MDNVVPIKKKANKEPSLKASEKKWGKNVMQAGFNILPSLIFKAQQRLGLTSQQLVVLLHLSEHWWEATRNPYPSVSTIADRMGLQRRQVQRIMKELEGADFVRRIERRASHKGKMSNEYDLSGLVKKLKTIAPEFLEAEEAAKDIKTEVTKPRRKILSKNKDKK